MKKGHSKLAKGYQSVREVRVFRKPRDAGDGYRSVRAAKSR